MIDSMLIQNRTNLFNTTDNGWNQNLPLRFLFLDLNAYFASVEQDARPSLAGKPVGIVPVLSENSILISASYEAKKYGIGTGTKVSDAIHKCPQINIIQARPPIYVHYHRQIKSILEQVLPIHKVLSIDEMSFILLGDEMIPNIAMNIAKQMKQILIKQIGPCIRCNIGIAPNTFLAKIASNMNKPDGLTTIKSLEIYDKIQKLQLKDFPGINTKMERRLIKARIYNTQDMLNATSKELVKAFGSIIGERWWYWLRGYEIPVPDRKRTTLGHSHVLPPEFRNSEGAKQVLIRLLTKASARLRSENLWCKGMSIYIKGNKRSWKEKINLHISQDLNYFMSVFLDIWNPKLFQNPILVSITFFNLYKPEQITLDLFDHYNKSVSLSHALDSVNKKFGKNKVFLASMNDAKETAQEKIAFQKTTLFQE